MLFLDTNILLEIILRDRAKKVQVENYLSLVSDPTAISMLSVHLVMYFGRKEKAEDRFLKGAIGENELLALLPEDYEWALKNEKRKDFEDALQVSVAIRTGCEKFITIDDKLAKAYADFPVSIITI
ncbi:MAG: type II toxin-antitoxin system VapC family toxin [Candidatus Saccharimonadales bacterium]